MTPRYSYSAINELAQGDTGHFVFLDAWSISALASVFAQAMPLYFWMNDQNPLTPSEIDDLDDKLATAQGGLMKSLVGLILPVCTASIPQGTLLCDGSTYQRVDYPALYDALDLAYITGPDEFTVPDMRDKFVLSSGPLHAPNTSGGSFTHEMTESELVPHLHTTVPHSHSEVGAVDTLINGGIEAPATSASPFPMTTGLSDVSVNITGGGEPMDITPPFVSLKYVVVAL